MSSKILKFSKDRLITGINIVDGMLFFTDNHSEPKKINIEKFKGNVPEVPVDHSTGTTSIYRRTFQEADITVIKGHPKHALTTDLTTSGGVLGGGGGGDGYGGDGMGDIIIDLSDGPVGSTFSINTESPNRGVSIDNILLQGRLFPDQEEIGEQGFYYTFSDSFGSRNDLSDIDPLIENVNNGVYKIQEDALNAGSYRLNVERTTAVTQGAAVGNYIYYIAYCIVKVSNSDGTQRDEIRFAPTKYVYKLQDTTSVPTGTISNLKVIINKSLGIFGGSNVLTYIYATFNNTFSPSIELGNLSRGFFISEAYKEIDNPSTPTISDIQTQIDNKPVDSQSLFPVAYNQATQTSFGILGNENQLNLNNTVDMSRLNTGDLYFVYSFIQLGNGTYVYSPVERFVVDGDPDLEGPFLSHEPANVQETEVGLNAEIYTAGAEATIQERGFVFSTEVDDINIVNRIFTDFNSQSPYGYNGNETINNTFKVPVPVTAGEDGLGDISISTENYLTNLLGGTTLYYVAYAINSRGQRSYASDEMLSVITQENSIPRIQAGIGLNYYKHNGANTDPLELIFTFKVLGGISDPTKVTGMGIEYAYATGPATGSNTLYGITYDNLIKFTGDEEHYKIDQAPTAVNLDVTRFDYTGTDTDEIIGDFKIKDGYAIEGSKYINPDDSALVEAIRIGRGDSFIEALSYTYGQPLVKSLSYYAYVIYDGVKYKSKVSRGWYQGNSAIWGDLTVFTPRYCGALALIAPSIYSGGRDGLKTHLPEKPPVGGTAEIFGAMCPNAPHGSTVGGSLQELGFYWSYQPIDAGDANIATQEKIKKWTEASTTNKVTATSGSNSGPNVTDLTNPVNTTTAAKNWHVGYENDDRGHFEFSATIGPFSSNATKIYWVAYIKPHARGDLQGYNLFGFSSPPVDIYANSSGGGALNSFSIGSNITTIDVEPTVLITSAEKTRGGLLGFTGEAEPGSGNYDISRKGFYIKPIAQFTTPGNQASVKTEMAVATNRTTLYTNDGFNPGAEYGASSSFSSGTYIASAFCEIVIAGTTYTRISDNNREVTLGAPQAATVITTPVVNNIGSEELMQGKVDAKGVAITSKGFYVLEVKGKLHNNPNLNKPSNGVALKSSFDSPPSNVTSINVPHSSSDTLASVLFRASIPNKKTGYVYYYAAYTINAKNEVGISNVVKHKEYQQVVDKFIEIAPVPFSHTIKADNRGRVSLTGATGSYGNQVSLKITTENNSISNFNFTVSSWDSGGRISSRINKRTSINGNFLDITLLEQNYQTSPRQCQLEILHATDPSKKVVLSIFQEGNIIILDEFDDFIWPPQDLLNDDMFGSGFGNLF